MEENNELMNMNSPLIEEFIQEVEKQIRADQDSSFGISCQTQQEFLPPPTTGGSEVIQEEEKGMKTFLEDEGAMKVIHEEEGEEHDVTQATNEVSTETNSEQANVDEDRIKGEVQIPRERANDLEQNEPGEFQNLNELLPQAPALPQETEEKVRESDRYSIFFKMLRMGVPMPAVKNKMMQKGVNPNILDLGEDALMTRVIALEKSFEAEQKQAKVPTKKGETIHWEAIPESQLINKETIFVGSDFELDNATLLHVKDLLELFVPVPIDPNPPIEDDVKSKKVKLRKERIESVLDSRRAQAVSIAMKKLRINPDTPAKFTWALREMNENVINSQAIEVLMSVPLWPANEEELQLLKRKSETGQKLAEPDRLLLFVIETVPDVVTRVNALAFRWEFEVSLLDTAKASIELKQICKQILENNNLKVVIRSAIFIGNAINAESGVQVKGCTLSSLVKLAFTKTIRDKSTTVLDCVAGYCLRCYPDFSSLDELMSLVHNARKIDLDSLLKSVKDMRRGIEAIRRIKQMESFTNDGIRRLDLVESELGSTKDFFELLLNYFGLSKTEMSSMIFFEFLCQFIEQWKKCIEKKVKEAKLQAAAQMAAIAAQKAAERAAQKAAEKAEKERLRADEEESNKGRLRLTVQFKGMLKFRMKVENKKDDETEKLAGKSSMIRKLPQNIAQQLEARRKDKENEEEVLKKHATSRPKGRKSIFWG